MRICHTLVCIVTLTVIGVNSAETQTSPRTWISDHLLVISSEDNWRYWTLIHVRSRDPDFPEWHQAYGGHRWTAPRVRDVQGTGSLAAPFLLQAEASWSWGTVSTDVTYSDQKHGYLQRIEISFETISDIELHQVELYLIAVSRRLENYDYEPRPLGLAISPESSVMKTGSYEEISSAIVDGMLGEVKGCDHPKDWCGDAMVVQLPLNQLSRDTGQASWSFDIHVSEEEIQEAVRASTQRGDFIIYGLTDEDPRLADAVIGRLRHRDEVENHYFPDIEGHTLMLLDGKVEAWDGESFRHLGDIPEDLEILPVVKTFLRGIARQLGGFPETWPGILTQVESWPTVEDPRAVAINLRDTEATYLFMTSPLSLDVFREIDGLESWTLESPQEKAAVLELATDAGWQRARALTAANSRFIASDDTLTKWDLAETKSSPRARLSHGLQVPANVLTRFAEDLSEEKAELPVAQAFSEMFGEERVHGLQVEGTRNLRVYGSGSDGTVRVFTLVGTEVRPYLRDGWKLSRQASGALEVLEVDDHVFFITPDEIFGRHKGAREAVLWGPFPRVSETLRVAILQEAIRRLRTRPAGSGTQVFRSAPEPLGEQGLTVDWSFQSADDETRTAFVPHQESIRRFSVRDPEKSGNWSEGFITALVRAVNDQQDVWSLWQGEEGHAFALRGGDLFAWPAEGDLTPWAHGLDWTQEKNKRDVRQGLLRCLLDETVRRVLPFDESDGAGPILEARLRDLDTDLPFLLARYADASDRVVLLPREAAGCGPAVRISGLPPERMDDSALLRTLLSFAHLKSAHDLNLIFAGNPAHTFLFHEDRLFGRSRSEETFTEWGGPIQPIEGVVERLLEDLLDELDNGAAKGFVRNSVSLDERPQALFVQVRGDEDYRTVSRDASTILSYHISASKADSGMLSALARMNHHASARHERLRYLQPSSEHLISEPWRFVLGDEEVLYASGKDLEFKALGNLPANLSPSLLQDFLVLCAKQLDDHDLSNATFSWAKRHSDTDFEVLAVHWPKSRLGRVLWRKENTPGFVDVKGLTAIRDDGPMIRDLEEVVEREGAQRILIRPISTAGRQDVFLLVPTTEATSPQTASLWAWRGGHFRRWAERVHLLRMPLHDALTFLSSQLSNETGENLLEPTFAFDMGGDIKALALRRAGSSQHHLFITNSSKPPGRILVEGLKPLAYAGLLQSEEPLLRALYEHRLQEDRVVEVRVHRHGANRFFNDPRSGFYNITDSQAWGPPVGGGPQVFETFLKLALQKRSTTGLPVFKGSPEEPLNVKSSALEALIVSFTDDSVKAFTAPEEGSFDVPTKHLGPLRADIDFAAGYLGKRLKGIQAEPFLEPKGSQLFLWTNEGHGTLYAQHRGSLSILGTLGQDWQSLLDAKPNEPLGNFFTDAVPRLLRQQGHLYVTSRKHGYAALLDTDSVLIRFRKNELVEKSLTALHPLMAETISAKVNCKYLPPSCAKFVNSNTTSHQQECLQEALYGYFSGVNTLCMGERFIFIWFQQTT